MPPVFFSWHHIWSPILLFTWQQRVGYSAKYGPSLAHEILQFILTSKWAGALGGMTFLIKDEYISHYKAQLSYHITQDWFLIHSPPNCQVFTGHLNYWNLSLKKRQYKSCQRDDFIQWSKHNVECLLRVYLKAFNEPELTHLMLPVTSLQKRRGLSKGFREGIQRLVMDRRLYRAEDKLLTLLLPTHQRSILYVLFSLEKRPLDRYCLSPGFSWDNETPDQKVTQGGKGSLGLNFHITIHHQRSQDRNSDRAETFFYSSGKHGILWFS